MKYYISPKCSFFQTLANKELIKEIVTPTKYKGTVTASDYISLEINKFYSVRIHKKYLFTRKKDWENSLTEEEKINFFTKRDVSIEDINKYISCSARKVNIDGRPLQIYGCCSFVKNAYRNVSIAIFKEVLFYYKKNKSFIIEWLEYLQNFISFKYEINDKNTKDIKPKALNIYQKKYVTNHSNFYEVTIHQNRYNAYFLMVCMRYINDPDLIVYPYVAMNLKKKLRDDITHSEAFILAHWLFKNRGYSYNDYAMYTRTYIPSLTNDISKFNFNNTTSIFNLYENIRITTNIEKQIKNLKKLYKNKQYKELITEARKIKA